MQITAKAGGDSGIDFQPLMTKLGHRPSNLVLPPRNYNEFRLAEDRRRIIAYAGSVGYFDISVDAPKVINKKSSVAIEWKVEAGTQYTIGKLKLVGTPSELHAQVLKQIPFSDGGPINTATYRLLRHALADTLRWHGYSHARVYTRAWIHREEKQLDWYYFVDPGPKTHIAAIEVVGNHRVSAGEILRRSGLAVGDAYGARERERSQLQIMDAGSMASVVIVADDDIHKGPPELPDSGGKALVDAQGDLAPRDLSAGLHLKISVIEAPRRELRLEAGVEADPSRSDAYMDTRLVFRDIGTSGLHLVSEGFVGYGVELGDISEPLGLYGRAKVQVLKSSVLGLKSDVRITAKLDHQLFPNAAVREYSAGPGFHKALADSLYLDMEVLAFVAQETEALALDAAERTSVGLSEDLEAKGAKLVAGLVWDDRDSGIEASDGYFASAFGEYAPDALDASHHWMRFKGDLRGFFPVTPSLSLAARGSGTWVVGAGDSGVPLHRRLFGGGAYGFRGYGRQGLSPDLKGAKVGGQSMIESSLEGRFLPVQKLYGAVAFLDLGAVSVDANPFAQGVFAAVGFGARLRTFYIPVAFDLSYRVLEESELVSPFRLDPWSVFVRLGEAF